MESCSAQERHLLAALETAPTLLLMSTTAALAPRQLVLVPVLPVVREIVPIWPPTQTIAELAVPLRAPVLHPGAATQHVKIYRQTYITVDRARVLLAPVPTRPAAVESVRTWQRA